MTQVLPPTGGVPTVPDPAEQPLHKVTPLIHSPTLSSATGHNIYLKLDCDQPSGSFKIRGIGKICQSAIRTYGAASTHLVTSSGGNAGLAVAYAASRAGVGSTIFVPSSTEADVVEKLRSLGAEVVIGGDSWDQANSAARKLVAQGKGNVYVHPFVGDELVAGHSCLVDEIYEQLHSQGQQDIDMLICSVGGGGMIRGIMQGLAKQPNKPTLVSVQNFGVDSFNLSLERGFASSSSELPKDVMELNRIASKCTSMGTKKCALDSVHDALRYPSSSPDAHLTTLTVTDDLSASACWQFEQLSNDFDGGARMVELSCASALTPVFHPWILDAVVQATEGLKNKVDGGKRLNVVIEVCGGNKVNPTLIAEYKSSAGRMDHRDRVRVNSVDMPTKAT